MLNNHFRGTEDAVIEADIVRAVPGVPSFAKRTLHADNGKALKEDSSGPCRCRRQCSSTRERGTVPVANPEEIYQRRLPRNVLAQTENSAAVRI
jgi:hypothetical protein